MTMIILNGKADRNEELDRDSDPPILELVDPQNFAEIISIDGTGGIGIAN